MLRNGVVIDSDDSLAIRAAWLHYAAGMTQAAVAKRLGIANVKAHRLITRANQKGAVKVTIDGEIAECVALEAELADRYGLAYCEVVPDLGEDGLPVRALGIAGASFLRREISGGVNKTIGLGHGRTLSAAINQMPRFDAQGVQFVSLLGGLTRNYAANPHDVMHRLAEKTGASAFVMPVPFFANSVEDRSVLLAQRGVREVFDLAARSDLKVVGIGASRPEASLVSSGMIETAEINDVQAKGGVGELLGHFFDAGGRPIKTTLTDRTLSIRLEDLKDTRIVALAGGDGKAGAIRSVLMSGCLSGLITDERTANALVTNEPS
jgi:DNA-binding transcriptional regulator LsrR (DeoR family)